MCTFILAWRAFGAAPTVVAANRDEATGRPASAPAVREWGTRVLAPRDEEAGGTWLGVNEDGVLVGITNRWTDAALPAGRSRGLLVRDALGRPSARSAAALVADAVERESYRGFNLVIADADDAVLLEWDGTLARTGFEPGVHVVVNVGADDRFEIPTERAAHAKRQAASARRARRELSPHESESAAAWRERAAAVLRDHEYGFCVHGDGYGTRSSSLITVDRAGAVAYAFADGRPCRNDYREIDGFADRSPRT